MRMTFSEDRKRTEEEALKWKVYSICQNDGHFQNTVRFIEKEAARYQYFTREQLYYWKYQFLSAGIGNTSFKRFVRFRTMGTMDHDTLFKEYLRIEYFKTIAL
jgi:hypothetical protein